MMLTEQTPALSVDFQRFEKLLLRLSRLLHMKIEIRDPEGNSVISLPHENPLSQGLQVEKYKAAVSDLLRDMAASGMGTLKRSYGELEVLGIPFGWNQVLAGILIASPYIYNREVTGEETAFLEELAVGICDQVQSQIEIQSMTQELMGRYEELNLVYDIGKELHRVESSGNTVSYIVEQAQETFKTDVTVLSVPGRNILKISYGHARSLPFDIHDRSFMNSINEAMMERLVLPEKKPMHLVINDNCEDKQLAQAFGIPLSMLAVPVRTRTDVAGFLYAMNFDVTKSFDTGDLRLSETLAEQISMVLTNSALHENLKDFMLNVIRTLVASIEAKDPYTRGHSERVSRLVLMIANAMGLSAEEKESLNWAAILHDIGKIGVSEHVLTKKGGLSSDELLHAKEHPVRGYRILKPIHQFKKALSGVLHHHERFDGTGYPSRLKGGEIPLYARIIAVADTYDAMTSTRSYRESLTHGEALAEMNEVKGQQLDPEIVEILSKLLS